MIIQFTNFIMSNLGVKYSYPSVYAGDQTQHNYTFHIIFFISPIFFLYKLGF